MIISGYHQCLQGLLSVKLKHTFSHTCKFKSFYFNRLLQLRNSLPIVDITELIHTTGWVGLGWVGVGVVWLGWVWLGWGGCGLVGWMVGWVDGWVGGWLGGWFNKYVG